VKKERAQRSHWKDALSMASAEWAAKKEAGIVSGRNRRGKEEKGGKLDDESRNRSVNPYDRLTPVRADASTTSLLCVMVL